TTMRGDARTVPAVKFISKATTKQRMSDDEPNYRFGYHCPSCGNAHQTIESVSTDIDQKPANAFCYHCGETLWMKTVPNRYNSFVEWARFEKQLLHAMYQDNPRLVQHVKENQPDMPKAVGMPRRIAAIEYIRRRMKNFF
ncbi:hypothetical protein, partial [Mycobacterium tuberculosis]|uniref:hypothetical protein n=1 Tax=Mycobacterium tuberculosis TaxID=1773 RepID=UPI001BACF1C1